MKKVNLLVAILFATMMSSTAYSQQTTGLSKDLRVNGCLKFGSNYAGLLGIKCSDNFGIYTEFSIFHKSGIGAAYYALDDFSSEETGRVRFVDLAYANTWGGFSLYAGSEIGWYDNWSQGRWFMQYAICGYTIDTWYFQIVPMLMYYPDFTANNYEFMVSGKITKTFFKDLSLSGTIWYDTSYGGVYGAIGSKIHLPMNFFIEGNVLLKDKMGDVLKDKIFAVGSIGFNF